MLLVLNLPLVGIWVRLLLIPRPWLYGGIMVFGIVGVYGLGDSELDLALMVAHRPRRLRDAGLRLPDRARRSSA